MLFCVDMSMLIHQMAHRLITNAANGEGELSAVPDNTANWCMDRLDKFTSQLGFNPQFAGCSWVAVFDNPSRRTFRHIAYPQYKADRTKEPLIVEAEQAVREAVQNCDTWVTLVAPSLVETDDVIASLVTQYQGKSAIHTEDTDYHQLLFPRKVLILKKSGTKRPGRPMELQWFNFTNCMKKFGVGARSWAKYMTIKGGKDGVEGWDGAGSVAAVSVLEHYDDLKSVDINDDRLKLKSTAKESYESFREKCDFLLELNTLRTDLPWPIELAHLGDFVMPRAFTTPTGSMATTGTE